MAAAVFLLIVPAVAQIFTEITLAPPIINTSDACSSALNQTVTCSQDLMWKSLRSTYLENNKLEALCRPDCLTSLQSVRQSILQACTAASDTIENAGGTFPASFVADKLIYAYSLACRRDSSTNTFCESVLAGWQADPIQIPFGAKLGCTDCALGTQQIQLSSPFGYDEGLAADFASITSSCSATGYAYTSPPPYAISTSAPPQLPSGLRCSSTYNVQVGETCNGIAASQRVSTSDLRKANNIIPPCQDLYDTHKTLCIPPSCTTYAIQPRDDCAGIAEKAGVSSSQFLSWNPEIDLLCGNLGRMVGEVICLSPPGGSPASTPTVTTTNRPTDAATAAPQPTNAEPKTNTNCGKWYTVQSGDICDRISLAQSISLKDFYFLNPAIDASCSNLLLGVAYCIQPVGDIATYANYPVTTNVITLSSPTYTTASLEILPTWQAVIVPPEEDLPLAAGTISDCAVYRNYHDPAIDRYDTGLEPANLTSRLRINTCKTVASIYEVNTTQLAQWNPSLDANSPECALQAGYRYCVLRATSDQQTKPPPPCGTATTVEPGTSPQCKCYTKIFGFEAGAYSCAEVASDHNVTINQMVEWNSWLGSDCDAGLFANLARDATRDLCVRIDPTGNSNTTTSSTITASSVPSSTSTTSSSTSSKAPIASGIISGCKDYYVVQLGDDCLKIQTKTGLGFLKLVLLNPFLGLSCTGLKVGFAICIRN